MFVEFEGETYIYLLTIKKKILTLDLYVGTEMKYKSKLTLEEIYKQLPAFEDYSTKEIENELKEVKKEDIFMEREGDKLFFKFKLIILKKEKHLSFDLIPSDKYVENEDDKEDYEYTEEEKDEMISELKKEINEQNKEIEELEKKIKKAEEMKSTLNTQIKDKEESLRD